MARSIEFSHDTLKFLAGLDGKRFKQVVSKALSLTQNPEPNDSIQMKGELLRRTDIGEYRIVYRFGDASVKIAGIGKRNDDEVYKKL